MDGPRLSPRERRILAEIEHALGEDHSLARTLGPGPPPRPGTGRLAGPAAAVATAVLGLVTAVLFVAAVATGSLTLLWSFAAAWTAAAICGLGLLLRRCESRAARVARAPREEPDQGDHLT
ncbi:DUF3040 domain-containing protein [Streptomyces sp. NPDC006339]|uniref:DUF3040 domain-containing protein n=1 Tax=Streptomyces sp. NPDC006339 TaxID=3156755 RepID=UPI0033A38492